MTDAQLKPCPFCGGDAKHVIDHTTECVDQLYCTSCFASITDRDKHGDCITLWNARADLSPVVKSLEWVDWEHTGRTVDGRKYLKRALTRVGNYFLMQRLSDGLFVVSYDIRNDEQHVGKTEAEAMQKAQDEQNRRILSALNFTPSDKDKEIERLRKALSTIEGAYYNEGEGMKRRAARMRALASAALEERG